MSDALITISADVADEAEASSVAQELAAVLRRAAPVASVQVAPARSGSMMVGELVMVAISHMLVTLVIDAIRLVWEQSRHPLKIEAPDGVVYVFRGNKEQLKGFMEKVLGGGSRGEQADAKG